MKISIRINLALLLFIFSQCSPKSSKKIDVQGHRGCRGLLPENTLSAFKKAIDMGVTTLELDVVISKDSQVVVSHEPWFNFEITTSPNGQTITESQGKELNIFQMNYDSIVKYDVGIKKHPRFLEQIKLMEHKPLLSEVFKIADEQTGRSNAPKVNFNIEIKSTVLDEKNGYQPTVSTFCDLVMKLIVAHALESRCTIQSFDVRVLNYMHQQFPNQNLAYLVENNADYKAAMTLLNFTPTIYSCDFNLLSKAMVEDLNKKSIKVIPWTVNENKDIRNCIALQVDGIISDYPNRVIEILSE